MSLLFDLIINPLVFIYDLVFGIAFKICSVFNTTDRADYALPIIAVSIMVNLLTLPLYTRADKIQEEEREKQKLMKPMVDHINRAFKGDERFMMLSTYYRQMHYKPIYAIRASVSLLLQIPFFTAAYRFFTTARFLEGQGAFLINTNPITFLFSDLSKPDNMFIIGAMVINILPIVMTLINFISSAIYTSGFQLKDRLQPFILAIIFLVILYKSPSGLVIYWTCNNIISLIKIVIIKIIKLKNKNKVSAIVERTINESEEKVLSKKELSTYNKIAIFSALSIGALAGLLIPTQIITSKPSDFVGWYSSFWPYIEYTFSTYTGVSIWLLIFYFLSYKRKKFSLILLIFAVVAIINYFVFYKSFGHLSPILRYDEMPVIFTPVFIIMNIISILVVLVVCFKLFRLKSKFLKYLSMITLFSFVLMTSLNLFLTIDQLAFKGTKKRYSSSTVLKQVDKKAIESVNDVIENEIISEETLEEEFKVPEVKKSFEESTNNDLFPVKPVFKLSKNGKNVVLIMIDKYQSPYFKYVLKEKPILREQFKGFTYYPNTVSFGTTTIYGTPGLFGGYEYIPEVFDRKNDGSLIKENQNESLKVLPKIFHDNGYDCVVSNVPYENYGEKTNSIYDYDNPEDFIATRSNLVGKTMTKSILLNIDNSMEGLRRNFLYYSLMKISPVIIQPMIYDDGNYLSSNDKNTMLYDMGFLGSFAVLERLCDYTKIVDDDSNNFFMMDNGAVHQPNMLSYPEFMPLPYTENIADKEFYDEDGNKFDGFKTFFTSTVGATILIGEFLDYLRENGVYDNTRIIIVADHGAASEKWAEYLVEVELNEKRKFNIKNYDLRTSLNNNFIKITGNKYTFSKLGFNPILLFKDFNSNDELKTSNEFMTNADTPTMLLNNLVENPINPYTGNVISSNYKYEKDKLYLTLGIHYNVETRRQDTLYQYEDEFWATIHDDIFNNSNWGLTLNLD